MTSYSSSCFVNPDHLGTPLTVTDSNGTIVWRWDRDPFGNGTPNENPDGAGMFTYNLRFPGQYYDQETWLHYNYFRDYNPKTGRYVQADPIGLGGGINLFAYSNENPLIWTDQLGLLTGIAFWQPVGWGESSFGHVSVDINGTSYSFGPGGMTIESSQSYIERNNFRDGLKMTIGVAPENEKIFGECLSNAHGSYSKFWNNCGAPIQSCLKQVGIDTGDQMLPVSLGNKLLDMNLVNGVQFYEATSPVTSWSAPWAK